MAKYLFVILVFFGICALFLPDTSLGWGGGGGGGWGGGGKGGWGGGKGGGSRPPSRPPGGGGGAPGGGAGRTPGAPGTGEGAGKGLSDPLLNQEFDFEFINDREDEYHRDEVASLIVSKN